MLEYITPRNFYRTIAVLFAVSFISVATLFVQGLSSKSTFSSKMLAVFLGLGIMTSFVLNFLHAYLHKKKYSYLRFMSDLAIISVLVYLYIDIIQGFRYARPIGQFYKGTAMVYCLYLIRDYHFIPKDRELLKLNYFDMLGIIMAVIGYWFFRYNLVSGMLFLWFFVLRYSYVGFNDADDLQHFSIPVEPKNYFVSNPIESIRNPFQVCSLPFLAWLGKCWFTYLPDGKFQRRYRAKIARYLFVTLKKKGLRQKGRMSYFLNGKEYFLKYNAANTAFQSLYLDRYKSGYENEVAVLIDHLVRPSDCFYDVGANYGYFSLLVASNPKFKGKVHAFELVLSNYQDLQEMTKISELKGRIAIHNMGIYSKEDTIKISSEQQLNGNCSIRDIAGEKDNCFEAKLKRLDHLNIEKPDIMKVDVEGVEYDVFVGCGNLLKQKKPHIIFESTAVDEDKNMVLKPLRYLQECHYRIFYVGWLDERGRGKKIESPEYHQFKPGDVFVVQEISLPQRLQMPQRVNLLAVHEDRLAELKKSMS
ncbi:MAG: FkbM family methyltransferase [Candidatus Omnitrophica bacterium]|nr:FkbM family methyltransferase [Candidatus Omnitrophota bacterium]